MRVTILFFVFCIVLVHSWPTQVTTDKGPIQGYSKNGLNYFIGIPYAQPPVGTLRWKPPMSHQPWSDVLNTNQFSNACIQNLDSSMTFPPNVTFNEDCLYLNIWAPDTPTIKPVMVWIHGGALTTGGNSEFRLRGEHMSLVGDVIVVNINYRLGTLGWLAHPAFITEDPEFPSSGNYGYLDQVAALEWVQTNIHLFGGDPKKVTIMGESAGGSSVCFHVAVKKSWGLYYQAIAESSACFGETSSLSKAQNFSISLQNLLNCKGDNQQIIQCMRAAPAQKILDLQNQNSLSSAVVDGYVFLEHPFNTYANGRSAQVPVISGDVRDEIQVVLPRPVSKELYQSYIKNSFPDLYSQVEQEYPCEAYNVSDCWYALCVIASDFIFNCPTHKMVSSRTSSVPSYTYIFSHPPKWGKTDHAFHSSEIAFVFSTLMDIYPYTPEEATLAHQLTYFWTSFGKTGNPNSDKVDFSWPVFETPTYAAAVFDLTLNITNEFKVDKCLFWDGIFKVMYNF